MVENRLRLLVRVWNIIGSQKGDKSSHGRPHSAHFVSDDRLTSLGRVHLLSTALWNKQLALFR